MKNDLIEGEMVCQAQKTNANRNRYSRDYGNLQFHVRWEGKLVSTSSGQKGKLMYQTVEDDWLRCSCDTFAEQKVFFLDVLFKLFVP